MIEYRDIPECKDIFSCKDMLALKADFDRLWSSIEEVRVVCTHLLTCLFLDFLAFKDLFVDYSLMKRSPLRDLSGLLSVSALPLD